MTPKKRSKDFVLDIVNNALDSLQHGVEHFIGTNKTTDLKYAVIHIFHAVELTLKARLERVHPMLIFEKPELASDDAKTVAFEILIQRLKKSGVEFEKDDLENLQQLRRVRNAIEHHVVKLEKQEAVNYVGQAAKFLGQFLKEHFGMRLKDGMDRKLYSALEEAIYSYEERLKIAEDDLEEQLPIDPKSRLEYERQYCEACGHDLVLVPDPTAEDGTVHCYFCQEKYYAVECVRCGCTILTGKAEGDDLCESCIAHLHDL